MSRILPILYTEMVRAILDNRKLVTRRIMKPQPWKIGEGEYECRHEKGFYDMGGNEWACRQCGCGVIPMNGGSYFHAPYQTGDILYIRETWAFWPCIECMDEESCNKTPTTHEDREAVTEGCYIYRADHPHPERITWKPSIHMPKVAARIWLKVTDVRVERLLEATNPIKYPHGKDNTIIREGFKRTGDFIDCWNSTIKKQDLDKYGWDADPWVWVIEFERCEKPAPCILEGIAPAEDKWPCIGYQKSKENDEPCEMCKGCRVYNGEKPEVQDV